MNSKKRTSKIMWLGIALLLALVMVGCTQTTPEPPAPGPGEPGPGEPGPAEPEYLTIGACMPITGPISLVGTAYVRGYECFFDKVNEQGGIAIGDKQYLIDFIAEDSKGTYEGARTAATKLVLEDEAKFIFGEILATGTQGIYEISAPNGALHVISWINVPNDPADVSPEKPLLVRLTPSPDDPQSPGFEYLKEAYPDVETIVICYPNIGYEPMIEECTPQAREYGMEIIGAEPFEWGTTDFAPIYTRILAHDPDAIMSMVSGQAQYQLVAARELGFKGPFWSSAPLAPDVFLMVAGPDTTDVICSGWDTNTPTDALSDFMQRWQAKYAEPFVADSVQAWDGAWTLVQGMEQAQSVDPEEVLAMLETMTQPGSLETCSGQAHMGGIEKFGVNRVLTEPIPLSHIIDGQVKFVGFRLP
jgi:branched-chain amino acid transport system substrate-binding protein